LTVNDIVRVGIIGPSWWVDYWHLPAIQNHPHAIITAICGQKERDREEIHAKYGEHARNYTDVATMLRESPLDGVIVCTPNDLHYPNTMAVLERGIHVTCEKPVALNAEQAGIMAEAAERRHLIGMCNFPYRDNPAVEEFRRLLASGYVGRLLHLSGDYHGGFGLQRRPNWRGLRSRSGAGILGDLGSHLIDLVRFITGDEFVSVCAHSLTVTRDPQSGEVNAITRTEDPLVGDRNDDSCAFLAELSSGAQAVLHTSWVAYQGAEVQRQEIEAFGTEGRLHFIADHTGTRLRGKQTSDRQWETITVAGIVLPGATGDDNEDYFRPGRLSPNNTTYRWIQAILTGKDSISPDLVDGWRAQQVIDAVILSSAERSWTDLYA